METFPPCIVFEHGVKNLFNALCTQQLMTPEYMAATRYEREIDERNRPLSDEELDAMFPQEGYTILAPPPGYQPIRTPSRKLTGADVW